MKKVIIGVCILLVIICLIPDRIHLEDGGTVVYNAILYQVFDMHRLNPDPTSADDYIEGTIVIILGIEVYNDVEAND